MEGEYVWLVVLSIFLILMLIISAKLFRLVLGSVLMLFSFLGWTVGFNQSSSILDVFNSESNLFYYLGLVYLLIAYLVTLWGFVIGQLKFTWKRIFILTFFTAIFAFISVVASTPSKRDFVIENSIMIVVFHFLSMLTLRKINIVEMLNGAENHVQSVIKESRDARFERELDALAKESPTAKSQVYKFRTQLKRYEDAGKEANRIANALGLYEENQYQKFLAENELDDNLNSYEKYKDKKEQDDNERKIKKDQEKQEQYNTWLNNKNQLKIGMLKSEVLSIFGEPESSNKSVTRSTEKQTFFYDGKKNIRGNIKYSLTIKIENDQVVAWSEE